ncbi:ABC transporter ATP-binding protein [Desulfohalobiaceae bacterium Ax17]|uniref:ABC transporter ATP-binding protein n=1 Tax=Desulfovulcanus ferrireducens TaxID=2831190 RepID=UPI00207BB9F5|nr:ABC transporter ATP-binding protein [Desulfovulcanus ferrireducens]MBT8764211.1 ABC transporter ATP-binding protein [Desulfovulcanus ferrireducens]
MLIQLKNIHKNFVQGQDEIQVLRDINLDIEQGEFVALQGVSGSGKSTLLHIIGLLDAPSSGQYFLQGKDVSKLNDDELSKLRNSLIGFVFQSFYLVPYITALDNVLLPGLYSKTPRKKLEQRAKELLTQLGLEDRMKFKPSQLSGGQQQRVALARALINDPQLILADEPTGQLDSKTSQEIMLLFKKIHAQGKTIILVTHDPVTANFAQRTIQIIDGQIATT